MKRFKQRFQTFGLVNVVLDFVLCNVVEGLNQVLTRLNSGVALVGLVRKHREDRVSSDKFQGV